MNKPKESTVPRDRKAPSSRKNEASAGTQVDLTSPTTSSAPPMPHERDEGSGMTGGIPSRRVQQGAKDVDRGVQDTSRGPEADQAYQKQRK
jgi:hypothetical protein